MTKKNKKSPDKASTASKKLRLDQIGLISSMSLFLLVYPGNNNYTNITDIKQTYINKENLLKDYTPALMPVRKNLLQSPVLSARGVYVFDSNSGVLLYGKNPNQKLAPASTTKIVTALVALDIYKPGDVLEVKNIVTDGKTMELFTGETMTVENLLYGSLVHSANDAAYVLADNHKGGIEEFIRDMNKKAFDLGLKDTRFANPVGYDDPNQFITARDLAILSNYALKNSNIAHIVGTKSITVADATYSYFHKLENVNELLGIVPGVAGVKTGFTEEAGENLATMVTRDGKNIIIVVLNSVNRFEDTKTIIDWVFTEFSWEEIGYKTNHP